MGYGGCNPFKGHLITLCEVGILFDGVCHCESVAQVFLPAGDVHRQATAFALPLSRGL